MNPITLHLAPSGQVALEIPSVLAEGRSHTVEVPLSLAGLSLLKTILVQRQKDEKAGLIPTIGRKSSPVASDISAFLVKRDREEKAAAKQITDNLLATYADIELEL